MEAPLPDLTVDGDPALLCGFQAKSAVLQEKLRLPDLYGENLLMVERGDTKFIDALRDEIEKNYPQIHIQDVASYGTGVFNQCDRTNSVMVTIGTWAELHPSLVAIPCEWDYTVPYGIVYAENPSALVLEFIGIMKKFSKIG